MILKVFLLFLLNHVVFDFIFQGKSIIKKRFPKELDLNNKKSTMKKLKVTINGNIIHSIFHLLGMLIIIIFIKVIDSTNSIFSGNYSYRDFYKDFY